MVDKYHLLQLEAPPWMELIPPADELGDILTPFLTVEVSGDILQGSLLYLGDQIPLAKGDKRITRQTEDRPPGGTRFFATEHLLLPFRLKGEAGNGFTHLVYRPHQVH